MQMRIAIALGQRERGDKMSRLIDADALIQMMRYATTDSDIGVFPIKIGFYAIVKVINAQPTIEPRKKGKWIFCENETGEGSNTYKCSACGEIQMIIDGTPKENGWAYCPHCGAKMDEEDIRDENMG